MKKQKTTIYECIKTIPIGKMLEFDQRQLSYWEKEVKLEIEQLKAFGLNNSKAYRRAILSLKWVQGIMRIKKLSNQSGGRNKPKKQIIMVVNLSKED